MIIPSIDLAGADAVQLIGGREQALNAGDPRPLAKKFGLVGEVAVIDLDAALGRGDNAEVIRELLPLAQCRVGGGIRSVEAARDWLGAGAASVILGTAATPEVLRELPRERVWAALDCVHGEVVDEGWTRRTGRDVWARMEELAPYVAGFLVTLVEREGRMTGLDLEMARRLREAAGDRRLTLAGGIVSAEEVATLDALGIDAQVGMALYTGALDLADAFVAPLRSDRPDGLIPTVVCDERGVALGLVYSDVDSVRASLDEGAGVYQSRTRGLWRKGATSGAVQQLVGIDVDCDRDTLRFRVRQAGSGFCHRGTPTCWGEQRGLAALEKTLGYIDDNRPMGSYTVRLLDDPALLGAKLREEADELASASSREEVVWEAADLFYFAMVRARSRGVGLAEIEGELARRARRVTRGSDAPPPTGDAAAKANGELIPQVEASAAVRRACAVDDAVLRRAAVIVGDVRQRGEAALVDWSVKLGDLPAGSPWRVDRAGLIAACARVAPDVLALLERTARRIRTFAEAQRAMFSDISVQIEGGTAGHVVAPVASAGCYAPGGRFPLPSSVLMTVIVARVAGVERVVVASPRADDVTLAAAAIAGADEVLTVGGAQAVAALAYGAGEVGPVDVIVGPGNAWVTAAKKLVSGDVGIDMLAGPSELVVFADATADPGLVAADLIAQAEHDPEAVPILVTTDASLPARVRAALHEQLESLPTATIARASLRGGSSVVVADLAEGIGVCDRLAPEHLELLVEQTDEVAGALRHYGGLFIGAGSAEVLGDYGAGPNHVLPTGGTARFSGGLSVANFLCLRTWLKTEGTPRLVEDAAMLGRLEGLEGHARSALRRA